MAGWMAADKPRNTAVRIGAGFVRGLPSNAVAAQKLAPGRRSHGSERPVQ